MRRPFRVSIHAPVRGATKIYGINATTIPSFNPRPCARGDTFSADEKSNIILVSIHAPVRGATFDWAKKNIDCYQVSIHAPVRGATTGGISTQTGNGCFNPRPCARGDIVSIAFILPIYWFQSTPLCEGRRLILIISSQN